LRKRAKTGEKGKEAGLEYEIQHEEKSLIEGVWEKEQVAKHATLPWRVEEVRAFRRRIAREVDLRDM